MSSEEPTVRLGYGASSNISFYGSWDTGIPRSEWDEMSEKDQNAVYDQAVYEIVDIYELKDDDPEPNGMGW